MAKTWLASQTKEEEVLGTQSFFVPGRVKVLGLKLLKWGGGGGGGAVIYSIPI